MRVALDPLRFDQEYRLHVAEAQPRHWIRHHRPERYVTRVTHYTAHRPVTKCGSDDGHLDPTPEITELWRTDPQR